MIEAPTTDGSVRVEPVRKAYEQVASQLRDLIVRGVLRAGQRLPTESDLARQFAVSRATIREALRVLSAQNLVTTKKGASGGSFVLSPDVDHISEFLEANLSLLSESRHVSLEEFLELRELLEVPAARLAAERRDDDQLEQLRDTVPGATASMGVLEQFRYNKQFHSVLVAASANKLLSVAAQPVFVVLQTNLTRSRLGATFHRSVSHDHENILAAISAGDPEAAGEEMRRHLEFLRPYYERSWKHARMRR